MKQIEVVAAIIQMAKGISLLRSGDMATIRTGGSFPAERWRQAKHLRRR